jgi:hypothetical protein
MLAALVNPDSTLFHPNHLLLAFNMLSTRLIIFLKPDFKKDQKISGPVTFLWILKILNS